MSLYFNYNDFCELIIINYINFNNPLKGNALRDISNFNIPKITFEQILKIYIYIKIDVSN